MPLRVVIAEDSAIVREGVVRMLEQQDDLEIVATCGDLPELEAAIAEHNPDVVVTDVRMPPTSTDEGVQAAVALRASSPGTGVVVLSQYADPGYASTLLDGGTEGRAYLLKERVAEPGQLADAVRAVADGRSIVDPKVIEALVGQRRAQENSPLRDLTEGEHEVLAALATGKSNAAIAGSLYLSERAVEKRINALFSKLGLTNEPDVNRRVMAVLLFLQETGG
jgi:DNA-binding NarL/FixJ family response regulator